MWRIEPKTLKPLRYILLLAVSFFYLSLYSQTAYEKKVNSLNKVVDTKATNNKFKLAIIAQQQLVNLHKLEKGDTSGAFLAASANLALLYRYSKQPKKTIEVLTEILPTYIYRYGEDDEDLPRLYHWLSYSYIKLMRYDESTKILQKSITFFNTNPSKRDENYYNALNNISISYRQLGLYDSAVFYLQLAFDYTQKTEGEDSYSLSNLATNLGLAYMHLGEYSKAEDYFKLSLNLIRKYKGEKNYNYARELLNLGLLYKKTYNYNNAINNYLTTIEILKTIGKTKSPLFAKALVNLSTVHRSKGEIRLAINYAWHGLAIRKQLYFKPHPKIVKSYMALGMYYDELEMKDSAGWCFTKSLETEEQLKEFSLESKKRLIELEKQINLLYDDYAAIVSTLEKELKFIEKNYGKHNHEYAKSLSTLAIFYTIENDYTQASATLIKAIQAKREYLKGIFNYLPQEELSTYLTKQAYDDNELAAVLLSKQDNPKLRSELLNNLLFLKGAILKNNSDVFFAIRTSGNKELLNTYNTYLLLKKTLGKEYSLPIHKRKYNTDSLNKEIRTQERKLIKQSSQYRDLTNLFETDWKDIQAKLKPNEAAIEFIRFTKLAKKGNDGEWYAALVIRKEYTEPKFILLSKEKEIKNILTKVAPKVLFSKRSNEVLGAAENTTNYGRDLYQLVWQKIEPFIKNCNTIYYSPDGILHQIAFNALPVTANTLLIDKYNLQQHLSLRNIKSDKKLTINSIAIFGGINYDYTNRDNNKAATLTLLPSERDRGSSFGYLKGTMNEALALKNTISNAKLSLYKGKQGSEEVFKSFNNNSPQVLHLATHGFFLKPKKGNSKKHLNNNAFETAENPLIRSGLVLAGGNNAWQGKPIKGIEDGILTAYEVSTLNLSNTQLVVLSACQTGLGDVKETEGVYGLQRAFKMAGVKQLIMSLWSVPDKETQELMELFYKELLKTKNTRSAFTNAQKIMREKYAPYYWAAFVLVE